MSNYFSLWIENLGVVPWFSFLFFLFLPIFLSLSFLLHLVCIVFDAMLFSLSQSIKITNNYRGLFVTLSISIVKIIFSTQHVIASTNEVFEEIFISKGEQIELSAENLENFIVGNKEIIKYKYFKRKHKIFVQGKSLGYTDLLINHKNHKKRKYKIYVISKRDQKKIMSAASALQKSGLKVETYGDIIHVSGKIDNLDTYLIYNQIIQNKKIKIVSNIELDTNFVNPFIASIYQDFLQANYESISCEIIQAQIYCEYSGKDGQEKVLKKYQNQFHINFSDLKFQKSLRVELLFTLREKNNVHSTDSGLSKISTPLSEYIETNRIHLEMQNLRLQNQVGESYIISAPKISAVIGEPFEIKLGAESPIQVQNNTFNSIEYKFAGLKFKGQVESKHRDLKVRYSMMTTKNQNNTFSGPSGRSTIYTKLNSLKEIFYISFLNNQEGTSNIPWLEQIPILGDLLSSHNLSNSQLVLSVYLIIKEDV